MSITPYLVELSLPWRLVGKEFSCNAGDLGLISGLGRSPGEENANSLYHSCLENSMDKGSTVQGVSKVGHD